MRRVNDLEKVMQQMRQYVWEDDSGHECRVSSNTVTTWANTIEQYLMDLALSQGTDEKLPGAIGEMLRETAQRSVLPAGSLTRSEPTTAERSKD